MPPGQNANQIKDGYNVQGYLSKYDPKDKIFMNWGRPDPQKGFSTFTQGIYEFFKNKSISNEDKIHAKFIFGCGKGVFDKGAEDKKLITTYMKKIAELENGKYAGNVLFVEGMVPNKLVGCVDYGFFTSRFEPCGISQLIAMAYGTVPVVRETGGLVDTVQNFNPETKEGTGFKFWNYDANGFLNTIRWAMDIYKDKKVWNNLIHNAMSQNFSWEESAQKYIWLYEDALKS